MNFRKNSETEEEKSFFETLTVIVFAAFLLAGTVLGFLVGFRPKVSEIEKRTLTEFPEYSADSFADGSYMSKISTWYSDTFPGREKMLTAEMNLQRLYGIRNNAGGHIADGDDIPDIPVPPETEPVESTGEEETMEGSSVEDPTEQTVPSTEAPEIDPDKLVDAGKELVDMNPQEAGNVNVKDLVGYCVYGFNLKAADRYSEAVAALRKQAPKDVRFYEMLAPDNSAVTLDKATRAAWKLSDEEKVIRYYHGKIALLTENVTTIPLIDTLRAHKDEYIYFRTDHHWTALGAYYAYQDLCKAAGVKASVLSDLETTVMEHFTGSYVHTNGYAQLSANADSITYYIPNAVNEITFWDSELKIFRTGKAIRNMSEFHERYGYMGFIYGDNSISYMTNPTLKNGRVCLLIKDSYGNCFAPFLIDSFERVVIVDYRYYNGKIKEEIEKENVTDVVFLNNLDAIANLGVMDVLYDRCN